MRQYKIYEKEEKQIEKIICNMCKKEIEVVNGIPREDVLTGVIFRKRIMKCIDSNSAKPVMISSLHLLQFHWKKNRR